MWIGWSAKHQLSMASDRVRDLRVRRLGISCQ
jgi:hypothetical protein